MRTLFPLFLRKIMPALAVLSGFVFWFVTVYAQVNPQINYQGKLTDSTGVAVANGTYNMRFWLIDSPTAATSTAVWTESLTGSNRVQVTNGLFSIMLGSTSPLTNVDFNQPLYLVVEIGGTDVSPAWDGEMSPRKILGSVPAAFEARRLEGLASSSLLRSDQEDTMEATSSNTLLTLVQNGAGAIMRLFSGATEVFTVLSNGNIGIGTSTPWVGLTVDNDIAITGGLYDNNQTSGQAGQVLQSTNGGLQWVSTSTLGFGTSSVGVLNDLLDTTITSPSSGAVLSFNGSQWVNIATSSLGLSSLFTTSAQLAAILSDETGTGAAVFGTGATLSSTTLSGTTYLSGNVGIGTTSPSARLTVIGADGSGSGADAMPALWVSGGIGANGGASGGVGGGFSFNGGWGGNGSSFGGQGGSFTAVAGVGGNSSGGASGGFGGNVTLTAGMSGLSSSGVRGGHGAGLTLGGGVGTGTGGYASLVAGVGDVTGGDTYITAGAGRFLGGAVSITAGAATTTGAGGTITLTGGNGTTTGNGGSITLLGGAGGVSGNAGNVLLATTRGSVGIGTTSPSQLLSVAGNARITGALFDSSNASGTSGMVLRSTGTGTQWVATSTFGFGTSSVGVLNDLLDTTITSPSSGAVLSFNGSQWVNIATSSLGLSSLFTTSAQLAAILSDETGTGAAVFGTGATLSSTTLSGITYASGSLGIGSTTPSSKLTVVSNTADSATATAVTIDTATTWNDSSAKLLSLNNGGTEQLVISGDGGISIGNNFVTDWGGYTAGNALTSIRNVSQGDDGYNGINLVSLSNSDWDEVSQWYADGDESVFNTYQGTYNNSSVGTDYFLRTSSSSIELNLSVNLTKYARLNPTSNDSDAAYYFDTVNDLSTNNIFYVAEQGDKKFVVDHNGNVGIGTSSPTAKLSIAGDLRLTGALRDTNNSAGTNGMVLLSTGSGTQWVATSTLGITSGSSFSNSAQLAALLSDETGTGAAVFSTGATLSSTTLANTTYISGALGIGTTTPDTLLGMQRTGVSGTATVGLNQYFGLANSVASAQQFGNLTNIVTTNTATTTIVGNLLRIQDSTAYGNTVRGLEVQTNRGTNTLGENTAISGFGRTFGVRGTTEGDAGAVLEPAGIYGVTRGTTQGNALRGYSSSITTASLMSLYQETSAFAGTGLLMNFGNSGGSFSSSTSRFIDLRVAGSSRLSIDATGSLAASGTISGVEYFLGNTRVLTGSTTLNNYFFAEANPTGTVTGFDNLAFGDGALRYLSSGGSNIALGFEALAGSSTSPMSGSYNIALGSGALGSNIDGESNAALGYLALFSNTNGSYNNAFGQETLTANTTGSQNNAFGYQALLSNTTGSDNNALGAGALGFTTVGYGNNALGYSALLNNTTGAYNNAIGYGALAGNNGTGTIAIGYQAGDNAVSVDRGIFIGYNVDAFSTTEDNVLNIGNLLFGNNLDGTGTTLSSGNIGIGTSSPSAKLTVAGTLRVTGGFADSASSTGTSGMVLLSTGNGTQWTATSSLGITAGSSFSNSSQLAALLSDETGTGAAVFGTGASLSSTTLSGATYMRGSLGIGTSSPTGALGVYSTTSAASIFNVAGTGASGALTSIAIADIASNYSFINASNRSLFGVRSTPFISDTSFSSNVNNYAFYGAPSGGTTDWGIYLTGEDRNYFSGSVGIGSTTPEGLLSLRKEGVSGTTTAGIDTYIGLANASAGATQFGNRFNLVTTNTATTTIVGSIFRIQDSTTFGNTLRGLEVQAQRGTNTLGENTAISGFARTFGVRGTTEGDAGAIFEPAGVYGETRGTTQGNAIRGYSSSITTATLLSLFQDTSAFAGTGLQMNFGNTTGSFSSSSSRFLDFKVAGTSRFVVNAVGTVTIGDGTNAAGLQIGKGGICVDSDGSCTASTSGRISATDYHTGNSDLAEMYFSDHQLLAGEIVALDGGLSVTRAGTDNRSAIIGVVSTQPGLTLGADDASLRAGQKAYPIALSGRVPIRLSTENGPIKKGDQLMLSSIPGVAMKASSTGMVIGVALEDFDNARAYSETFINQFGENLIEPEILPFVPNDPRINDGCYYGAGGAAGETPCVPLKATSTDAQQREAEVLAAIEAKEEALAELAATPSDTQLLADGREVKVGQVVMFVKLQYRYLDEEREAMLVTLMSTSTYRYEEGEETAPTLFDRMAMLASSFMDGVLSIFKLDAEEVKTEKLCVGTTCVDEAALRQLLERSNNEGQVIDIITTPTPTEDEVSVDPGLDDSTPDPTPEAGEENSGAGLPTQVIEDVVGEAAPDPTEIAEPVLEVEVEEVEEVQEEEPEIEALEPVQEQVSSEGVTE